MKNYAPMLVLGMFVLSACIKHPEELPLPKPFLIKKVEMLIEHFRRIPKPGDTARSRDKWIWEIEYNADCQIRLVRFYTSFVDTMKMRLSRTTVFLYDSQGRIKETQSQSPSGLIGRRIFSYHGNNKLPFLDETIPRGDFVQGWLYRGDTVIATLHHDMGVDTLRFLYQNGNLLFGIGRFDKYDNAPPIQKFMNLSRGDILKFLPFPYVTPRLSRNNWTEFHTSYVRWRRYIRHNELGLPYFSSAQEEEPGIVRRYSTRFEY